MENKLYVECEGRKSDSVLIENFPAVIKSVFIDEIGLLPGYQVDLCIDINSFNEAGNPVNGLRKDWRCAASIDEIYSMDLISELSRESAVIVMPNYLNNEKIIVLEEKSTEKIITIDDILSYSNGAPGVKIYKTNTENIYNSFIIEYCLNYLTGEFSKIDFINKDESSLTESENYREGTPDTFTGLCLESYNRYMKKAEYIIKAKYIRDRTTAINSLKWFTNWLTRKRYIIEIDAILNANTIDIEVGDQLKLNLELLPEGVSNSHNFIVTELDINYLDDIVNLKLFEISYPL
jgi:hypothetical protein